MKTARFLLACLALSPLTACGGDGITTPAGGTAPRAPAFDRSAAPSTAEGPSVAGDLDLGGSTGCVAEVVIGPTGNIIVRCVVNAGAQLGTGT
jgi:hypothetical protein